MWRLAESYLPKFLSQLIKTKVDLNHNGPMTRVGIGVDRCKMIPDSLMQTRCSFRASAAAKKGNKNKKWAYYNKDGERLDLALPAKVPGAAASLEARMKRGGKKMCNHWYVATPTLIITDILTGLQAPRWKM